ncbi:MAG TPA: tagaturonate reductase [Puia sp.]|nr:tagaturonate reductase [Puia sp.]
MLLSKQNIGQINATGVEVPDNEYFELPEKVLQFGTGVLLRGLCDYFIDKANKKKIFNGRVVMVKSTDGDAGDAFKKQDCLYTLCVRGTRDGKNEDYNIINASVSRLLFAKKDWAEILLCAASPDIQIVISNTTEVGLVLTQDNVHASPPESFPGKLLACLYERYKIFRGDPSKGMVIIPTELIPQNGEKLFSILEELARQNGLEEVFIQWLMSANCFCNSLVDRIVPGKLNAAEQRKVEAIVGYEDELMITSEEYRLWAIESSNEKVKEILSFAGADPGVVIAADITLFRELKLRLLNGSHTFSCGLAYLAGFGTVKGAMSDVSFAWFIKNLMCEEIAPAIKANNLSIDQALDFAAKVLNRYRNPYIEHHWLSITLQYTSKMRMRNVPTIKNYFQRFGKVPGNMSLGFAGYLLFMKSVESSAGKYYGEINGQKYLITDESASYYHDLWQQKDLSKLVEDTLSNQKLWGCDLTEIRGFAEAVHANLSLLMNQGAKKTLENIEGKIN